MKIYKQFKYKGAKNKSELSILMLQVLQRDRFSVSIDTNIISFKELRTHFNSRIDLMREISFPKLNGSVSVETEDRSYILRWKIKLYKPILTNLFALLFVSIPILLSGLDLQFYLVPIIMIFINSLINIITIHVKIKEITEIYIYSLDKFDL